MLKNREIWPFLAKFPKKWVFRGITPKRGFFALFGVPRAGVLHQPLAAGPCPRPGVPGSPGWGSPHRGEGRIPFLPEGGADLWVAAGAVYGKEVLVLPRVPEIFLKAIKNTCMTGTSYNSPSRPGAAGSD